MKRQRRVKNFERVYGLSERWSKHLEHRYNEIRESVRNALEFRGEDFTQQNIERQLQIEFKTSGRFSRPTEGAYLRSQYIKWIQKKLLDSLLKELTR
jgi:hypothetical protein